VADEYNAELVAKAVLTKLQSDLSDALDDVEDAWDALDSEVTLPDPVTWFEGHEPTVLEMESSEFPFVAVLAPESEPQERPARWGFQEETVRVLVHYFVVADDADTVNKRSHRYAQAIRKVLQGQRNFEGYEQTDYRPHVRISTASRHGKTTEADMFDSDQVDYIQMGEIEVRFDGG
jgi:hypothetical protein